MYQNKLYSLSKTKNVFKKTKIPYQKFLRKRGFNTTLEYVQKSCSEKRKKKETSLLLQPAFLCNIKNQPGKEFLKLVDKHIPKSRTLNKILNRYTIKITYLYIPNLEKEISKHNHKVFELNETAKNEERIAIAKLKITVQSMEFV